MDPDRPSDELTPSVEASAPATPPRVPPALAKGPRPRSETNILRVAFMAGAGCASVVLVFTLVAVVAAVMLALGIESGRFPDSAAQPKNKIPPQVLENLRELGVVEPDETVFYFYSAALFDMKEDGNLFTERRVISYQTYEDEFYVYEATYDEIESLEFDNAGDWASDSSITVSLAEDDWFVLLVSAEGDGDKAFFGALEKQWRHLKEGGGESGAQDAPIEGASEAPTES